MKKIIVFFVLTAILTNSCIDQLDVNTDRGEFILVIEGFISTQPSPHVISITKSVKYGSAFVDGVIRRIRGAKVFIRDQRGEITFLTEFGFGFYLTPAGFRAVVGNSYTLQIITGGMTYYSTPELVTKAPEIDSLILKFKKFPSTDPLDFVSGVEVYSQWRDPENEINYYMWESFGTYKIDNCWIYDPNGDNKSIRIMKDKNSNGNLVTDLAAFIEDDGGRYMDKYYITVQQLSISEEAFVFFKLLDNQLSINGDIFDPPPATIRGNIISLDDPDQHVIGYFMAADVSVKSVFIPREILEVKQLPRIINNCLTLTNSTTVRPPFWID